MKAQLLFRDRKNHTQTFSLKGSESILGRDAGIAVPIARDGISRQHARIVAEGSEYVLEDLRSTNGTFLNGQAVARDQLRHLDVIGLGKVAELIFMLREDAAITIRRVVVLDASLTRDSPGATPEPLPVGEVTVGRSSACNIVSEQGAVSKIHLRIVRTQKQITLEDLGSSNGTFVNGERVMTAVLQDGDVLTLGSVDVFKVKVELGEVTSASGAHEGPASLSMTSAPKTGEMRRFSADWKTRYEWDPSELAELAELQKKLHDEEAARKAPAREKAAPHGKTKAPPPPKPAAAKPDKPVAPAGAAPAVAKASPPAPAPRPTAAPPPAPPAAPAKAAELPAEPPKAPAPQPPAAVAPVPRPEPPKPAAPPPPKPPAPPAPPPPAVAPDPKPAPGPSASGRIVEVRLRGTGIDVGATESGAHEMGRDKAAPLRINHPTVSRQHARVIISDDRGVAYLQDRGGANGTRLNGAAIKEIQLLSDGDTISVGDVDLKVSIRRV